MPSEEERYRPVYLTACEKALQEERDKRVAALEAKMRELIPLMEDAKDQRIRELENALRKLVNEVKALVGTEYRMAALRDLISTTNTNILIMRVNEAAALLEVKP